MGILDRAKDLAGKAKTKAGDVASKAGDVAAKGVDAAATGADKVTGGKHHDRIEKISGKIEQALDRDGSSGTEKTDGEADS